MGRLSYICCLLLLLQVQLNYAAGECQQRQYEYDSFVCVCDSQTCDEPGPTVWPASGTFSLYTSTRDKYRFMQLAGTIVDTPDETAVNVTIRSMIAGNQILGFGAAFTDSAGININLLPAEAQDRLLRAYFSPDGIEYNLCRIPIAGTDCSTRPYSYDDVEGDVELEHWALQPEDIDYKIPLIKRAMEMNAGEMFFFASPWSPPAWMKTNGMFNESGQLLPEMWQPWSDYFVKFVHAYQAEGVRFWGLTAQNEPTTGFNPNYAWNTCGWTAEDMRDWIKDSLGPTLDGANMGHLKLMVVDESRQMLPHFPKIILDDPVANDYVDGVAVHWYADDLISPDVLTETHKLDPSKFLLYTEAAEGSKVDDDTSVSLGSWTRGEHYFEKIIESLNYFSNGWVDWNLALDTTGGPNWASNYLDAAIIVNQTSGEFYKQPTFYAMGHASKFIKRYAIEQETTSDNEDIKVSSITNPDGTIVLLLLNKAETQQMVSIDINSHRYINLEVAAKSFQTLLIAGR